MIRLSAFQPEATVILALKFGECKTRAAAVRSETVIPIKKRDYS
jgi:hypothetical protein